MKKYSFIHIIIFIIFIIYCISVILLSRNSTLQYEWISIIENIEYYNEYRYLNAISAYMPPLYPYYLWSVQMIFGKTYYIFISCIFQSILLYFSIFYLFNSYNPLFSVSKKWVLGFIITLFFPPILYGATKVSSFALSLVIFNIFISLFWKFYNTSNSKYLYWIFIISIFGFYTRFEFIYILIFSILFLVFKQKISIKILLLTFLFSFLTYLPWSIRNYQKIGIFSYSTSLEYNFAKGNHIKYDIFSSLNLPFDPIINQTLTDEYLYEKFKNEKEKNEYLRSLNKKFIKENPRLFITNTVQKIGIHFLQYFPDNPNFTNAQQLSIIYSIFFTIFHFIILYLTILKNRLVGFSSYVLGILVFYLLFYSIAPLPRYLLFFLPFFIVYLLREINFLHKKIKTII